MDHHFFWNQQTIWLKTKENQFFTTLSSLMKFYYRVKTARFKELAPYDPDRYYDDC
jgi:ribosomal protein S19E (S16A)